jgi:hypothetical protein
MYMQPIVPVTEMRGRSRATGLKLAAGIAALGVAAVVMPIYWAVTAAWLVTVGFIRGTIDAAQQAYDCLLFAGEDVLGR